MRNCKNKLFEDFFDDIDKDDIIDDEVEETEDTSGYKEYSHSFGIDCPVVYQKISPIQPKPLLQLLSYIEASGVFRRYCLKIVLCPSIYQPAQNENKIIKTFEFNPDRKISAKKFVDDYIDYIKTTNIDCVSHYHFTFDINTSISFSKFVILYINVCRLLSCVTREQSLNKLWKFKYFIFGTIFDERYRIFGENTYESEWELTNSSRYCEVIDTLYKMFCTYGCTSPVSKRDIDRIRQKWEYDYEIDYHLMLAHFELTNHFEGFDVKVSDFGHFERNNYTTDYIILDHKVLPENANEPLNGTLRIVPFRISQLDSLLSSCDEKKSLLTWTLDNDYVILNAIVDMVPNYDEKSRRGYNLNLHNISNSLISGLTEDQFVYFCEKYGNDEMNVFIDDIIDIPVGETRVFDIEKWKVRKYDVYDNKKTGKKFSIKLTKSRKKNVTFSKLTLKRLK